MHRARHHADGHRRPLNRVCPIFPPLRIAPVFILPVGADSPELPHIEQDHRKEKQRCYPMLGFKTFGNAPVTLSGIELANKIKKGQFDTSEINGPGAMILQAREAALAA
jgi:hypothetical protein